jgi:hypothetical protein
MRWWGRASQETAAPSRGHRVPGFGRLWRRAKLHMRLGRSAFPTQASCSALPPALATASHATLLARQHPASTRPAPILSTPTHTRSIHQQCSTCHGCRQQGDSDSLPGSHPHHHGPQLDSRHTTQVTHGLWRRPALEHRVVCS